MCYRLTYILGFKRSYRSILPVVCVGSAVVGGSGKTPATVAIVAALKARGYRTVVSSPGYRSPMADGATLAPDGELDAKIWGDEAAVLRLLMPDVPLIVGRKRVDAAKLAEGKFANHVLVMDDGMQHLPLEKGTLICLDDPSETNHFCVPAGPYREPSSHVKRAHLVVPGVFTLDRSLAEVALMRPTKTCLQTKEGPIHVLTSIARPDLFVKSLEEFGFDVEGVIAFADHDPLEASAVLKCLPESGYVVVTLKDWVKLVGNGDMDLTRFAVAFESARFEPDDLFPDWLVGRLNVIP